jgi:hypothetical protein
MQVINFRDHAFNLANKKSDSIEVGFCFKTKKELFFKSSLEEIFVFDSFGACRECGNNYHITELHGNISSCGWPVEYLGCLCKDCFAKPDPEVELTESEKKILKQETDEE